MYGFPDVSEAAGLLDVVLSAFLGGDDPLDAWRAQLGELVAALDRSGRVAQEALPGEAPPGEAVPVPAEGDSNRSLVLVVDDEQPVRDAIRFYLEQVGFRSVSAADGEQAMEMAARHQPDVILMDIQMPNMDGLQATQRLGQDPRLKSVPVVFLTAEDSTDTVLKALSYSSDGYLVKPVEMEEIAVKLTAVLADAA